MGVQRDSKERDGMLVIMNDLLRTFAPTRHASETVPATYHKRPANVACRRISELNQLSKRSDRIVVIRNRGRVNCDRRRNKQLALLARQELQFKPAKDVIDNGLGEADFGIARPPAGLEAHVSKLAAQDFERDTMLEASDTAVANESMSPEMVEPCFDMVRKISPGRPSS